MELRALTLPTSLFSISIFLIVEITPPLLLFVAWLLLGQTLSTSMASTDFQETIIGSNPLNKYGFNRLPRNFRKHIQMSQWLKKLLHQDSCSSTFHCLNLQHIPLLEFASFDFSNFTGVKKESISFPSVNSGFFVTMVEAGDVKAVFTGHDHINDFCGELTGIQLCYGGGFGYHVCGKDGWARRARVITASLEKTEGADWGGVNSVKTWKRPDDKSLTAIDGMELWNNTYGGNL